MSTYRLDRLLRPRSVAVVGASPRETSPGRAVLENLMAAGFEGPIHLVNPRYAEISGVRTVPSLSALSQVPDLVIIAAPPAVIPALVDEAGRLGSTAAIIISAGLGHGPGSIAESVQTTAAAHGLRLVGPNCLGVQIPGIRLNASFAARQPRTGELALLSQSGAIVAALIEWAEHRRVGFSAVVSLGDTLDVDFGDLLDHYATDPSTRAILLYVESLRDARKFMAAARAAVRAKPVVVLKAGRHAAAAQAAMTHTGALAGSDAVYDAAFLRAGLLRVRDLEELYTAAETLAHIPPFAGDRLAVLTNGGGIGVLAVDRLADLDGTMATLSPATVSALDATLPNTWSRANPVDIAGDADAARYARALSVLESDPDIDAILALNIPTALGKPALAAAAIADAHTRADAAHRKPLFAAWVGDDGRNSRALQRAGIAVYPTESEAVSGFMHLVRYQRALATSCQVPAGRSQPAAHVAQARAVILKVLSAGRRWLDPVEVATLLSAYGIPVTPVAAAESPEAAVLAARAWLDAGQTVVLKLMSPDITHKSEVGGVRLNLRDEAAVRQAAQAILAGAAQARPDAHLQGVTVHPMIVRPKSRELIAGIADDAVFGPVVLFGCGGTAVEVINDRALALPPLDDELARGLMARTRIARLLDAYRDVPAADQTAIVSVLIRLGEMAADLPELRELDLNPLLADEHGVLAVDARIAVAPAKPGRRLAVHPYPGEWDRPEVLADGSPVRIRPARRDDLPRYEAFFASLPDGESALRRYAGVSGPHVALLPLLMPLDYARTMAFLVIGSDTTASPLAIATLTRRSDDSDAGARVLSQPSAAGQQAASLLLGTLSRYAQTSGIRKLDVQLLDAAEKAHLRHDSDGVRIRRLGSDRWEYSWNTAPATDAVL